MFEAMARTIDATPRFNVLGRVKQVVGLVVESNGPQSRLGDVCLVEPEPGAPKVRAEVVGFRGGSVVLMPLGDMTGIRSGSFVEATGECLRIPAGPSLLGRAINGLGEPMDGKGPIHAETTYPVLAPPPNALQPRRRSPSTSETRASTSCS
jgi:flagellum-specific ATP synthase